MLAKLGSCNNYNSDVHVYKIQTATSSVLRSSINIADMEPWLYLGCYAFCSQSQPFYSDVPFMMKIYTAG